MLVFCSGVLRSVVALAVVVVVVAATAVPVNHRIASNARAKAEFKSAETEDRETDATFPTQTLPLKFETRVLPGKIKIFGRCNFFPDFTFLLVADAERRK